MTLTLSRGSHLPHEEAAGDGEVDTSNQLALEGEHLQPYVEEAATVLKQAATVYGGGCNRMRRRLQPCSNRMRCIRPCPPAGYG